MDRGIEGAPAPDLHPIGLPFCSGGKFSGIRNCAHTIDRGMSASSPPRVASRRASVIPAFRGGRGDATLARGGAEHDERGTGRDGTRYRIEASIRCIPSSRMRRRRRTYHPRASSPGGVSSSRYPPDPQKPTTTMVGDGRLGLGYRKSRGIGNT